MADRIVLNTISYHGHGAIVKSLKDPAQIENAKRIWGKGMTGPVTLDRIIRELQKKRSLL